MFNRSKVYFLSSFLIFSLNLPWQQYKNEFGKFTVLLPGAVKETSSKVKTVTGELVYHQFVCRTMSKSDGKILYTVNYCDYPAGTFPKDSTELREEFYKATIESSTEAIKGTVAYQDNILQQDYNGKIWRVDFNKETAHIKSKCFLIGDRFYLLQIIVANNEKNDPNADKFFDTFLVQL